MSYTIRIRRQAAAEFREATRWYESKRAGLGREFALAVDAALSLAAESPERYPELHNDIRRILVKRFPYGVFYRIVRSEVIVLAIIHLRRDPARWRNR